MKTIRELSESEREVLAELGRRIRSELPGSVFRMMLFGSRARGDAQPDSDMDILLEVERERLSFADKRRLCRVAGEVSIDSGIVVSLLIVDRHTREERGSFSVFETIRQEGIPV